jgi:hypothetical protein
MAKTTTVLSPRPSLGGRFSILEEPLARVRALTQAALHWNRGYHNAELAASDQVLFENVLDQLLMLLRDEVEELHELYHDDGEG